MPFPDEWERILERNISLYRYLPDALREQFHNDIKIFITEKHFEGLGGLEINDEIKVTIAAEASMLLLNRKNSDYPKLSSILVYPSVYVTNKTPLSAEGYILRGQSVRRRILAARVDCPCLG
jgi:Mlc titration factor MtfA (ptsG expression regulator)